VFLSDFETRRKEAEIHGRASKHAEEMIQYFPIELQTLWLVDDGGRTQQEAKPQHNQKKREPIPHEQGGWCGVGPGKRFWKAPQKGCV